MIQQGLENPEELAQAQPEVGAGDPASPEDEAELNRANSALAEVLYKNDSSFKSTLKKLSAENIPPLNRLSDTTMMLVTEIDNKINVDEGVILHFVATTYMSVYEVAETAGVLQLSEVEVKKGLMVTLQLALEAYGVSEADFSDFADSIGEKGAAELINMYQQETSQWAAS
jgi:hypothetical protein